MQNHTISPKPTMHCKSLLQRKTPPSHIRRIGASGWTWMWGNLCTLNFAIFQSEHPQSLTFDCLTDAGAFAFTTCKCGCARSTCFLQRIDRNTIPCDGRRKGRLAVSPVCIRRISLLSLCSERCRTANAFCTARFGKPLVVMEGSYKRGRARESARERERERFCRELAGNRQNAVVVVFT